MVRWFEHSSQWRIRSQESSAMCSIIRRTHAFVCDACEDCLSPRYYLSLIFVSGGGDNISNSRNRIWATGSETDWKAQKDREKENTWPGSEDTLRSGPQIKASRWSCSNSGVEIQTSGQRVTTGATGPSWKYVIIATSVFHNLDQDSFCYAIYFPWFTRILARWDTQVGMFGSCHIH